jgi:hypothetical protein
MPAKTRADYVTLDLVEPDWLPVIPQYVPILDRVYLQLDHELPANSVLKTPDGRSDNKQRAGLAQARVLEVGPDVSDLEIGDVVLLEQHAFSGEPDFMYFPKDNTAIYPRRAVAAVVERS